MNFPELIDLFINYWPHLLAMGVVLVPTIGFVVQYHFKNRLEEKEAQLRIMNARISELESTRPTAIAQVKTFNRSWPETNADSRDDLIKRIKGARKRINVFGLTRNFYASDEMRDLILNKSREVPVVIYMMNPTSIERIHRYKIEPIEASFEDPERYRREIESPFIQLASRSDSIDAGSSVPGIGLYYYNFPCSFAIEEIDDTYRVMLYGHGVRGTESPILTFDEEGPFADYFARQIRWLERLAVRKEYQPWASKGVSVLRIQPDDSEESSSSA